MSATAPTFRLPAQPAVIDYEAIAAANIRIAERSEMVGDEARELAQCSGLDVIPEDLGEWAREAGLDFAAGDEELARQFAGLYWAAFIAGVQAARDQELVS